MKPFAISLLLIIGILFSLVAPNKAAAQGCTGITFSFEHYEPCHFRAKYNNTTDCFNEIRYSLQSGTFLTTTVNSAAGFTMDVISPSEVWIHHVNGFLPLGNQVPLLFTLPTDLVTTMDVTFNDQCAQLGCVIFGGFPIESCPDPQDASIIGVKYRECNGLPYSNQPLIPNWPIQLLDTMGTVLSEVLTDSMGAYQFYDLHSGTYTIKEGVDPHWTPKIPPVGMYAVTLDASQQAVRNFGNCPDCSCDRMYMDMVQCPSGWDTICAYALTLSNTGAYCFSSIDISTGLDSISGWTLLESGWTVTQMGTNQLKLKPTSLYIPTGSFFPLRINVTGPNPQNMSVSTTWVTNGAVQTCTRDFSFQCPPPPIPPPCCPAGSQFGPEVVLNGDFELGNQDFTSDYAYFIPGNFTTFGAYSVLNQSQVYAANTQWACLDHTTYSPTGKMLIVDGYGGPIAWQQTVNVVAGTAYSFSAWFNNLVVPSKNYDDPQMALFVGNTMVAGPLNLPETPDQWIRLCEKWTAPTTGTVALSIQMLANTFIGNDVAIDDISFKSCLPGAPCGVTISANPSPFCGTGTLTANPTGTGPFSYQWSHGQNTQSINVQGLPCGATCSVSVTCADGSMSSATYTVSDNVPPVALCNPGIGVILDGNCQYHVTPAFVDGGSSDNCGIQSMIVSPTVLTGCGNTIVTLTVTDFCGNTSTCSMGVQTIETVPPVMTCPPNTTVAGVFGPDGCTIPFQPIVPVVFDNCTASVAVSNNAPAVLHAGSNVVTWTAEDDCGNTVSCTVVIEVTCSACNCPSGEPGAELVEDGDFTNGGNFTSNYVYSCSSQTEGQYCVGSNPQSVNQGFAPCSDFPNGTGKMVIVNGSTIAGKNIWCETFNLPPNTYYIFSYYATALTALNPAQLQVFINGAPVGTPQQLSQTTCEWQQLCYGWNTGSGTGSTQICIRDLNLSAQGNDFAVDLVSLKSCNQCAARPAGLLAWWPMDEYNYEPVSAEIVNGYVGTAQGGPIGPFAGPDPVQGKVDYTNSGLGALHFSGPGPLTYLETPNDPAFNFGNGSFSIDAWVFAGSSTQTAPIINKIQTLGSGYSFSININNLSQAYPVLTISTTQGNEVFYGPLINNGQWNFVGVVVSPPTVKFYVGNDPGGSSNFVISAPQNMIGIPNASSPVPLTIGYNNQNEHWDISIDELEMFNTAISDADMHSIWAADANGKCRSGLPDKLCQCGGIDNLYFLALDTVISPITAIPAHCGDAELLIIPCDVTKAGLFWFRGDVHCDSDSCLQNDFSWSVTPVPPTLGTINYGTLSNNNGKDGHFDIQLNYADYSPGTNYALTITYFCGNKTCTCTVIIRIEQCPPCHCGGFTDFFVRNKSGSINQSFSCGDEVNIFPCTPEQGLSITGNFNCEGNPCSPEHLINWTLTGPNNSAHSGSFTDNDPLFGIYLYPGWLLAPGTYTLTMNGNCGTETCPCVITFHVDCPELCPCDQNTAQEMANRVSKGFAISTSLISCKACFYPLAVSDCETVTWHIGAVTAPPIGSTSGKQSFCYTFPVAGTYTVFMKVTRLKPDGTVCAVAVKSRSITISCGAIDDCNNTLIHNHRFSENPMAGGLTSGGNAPGWEALAGNPVLYEDASSPDGWAMVLTGNYDTSDVLSTAMPFCISKNDTGTLEILLRAPSDPIPGIPDTGRRRPPSGSGKIMLFTGANLPYPNCQGASCYELADLADLLPFEDDGWYQLSIPYNLRDWSPLDSCGDKAAGVPARLAMFVYNYLSPAQSDGPVNHAMIIDDLCLGAMSVGTQNPEYGQAIRLYPNPTTGVITLELNISATPGMRNVITDLAGRIIQENLAEPGANEQKMDTGNLPSGLYFIQVISDGHVLAIEKFVKQ